MLISRLITWIILSAILILVLFLLVRFYKQKKFNELLYVALFFLIAVGIPVLFSFMVTTVYVIESKTDYSAYFKFGTPDFKMKNGSTVQISFTTRKGVVNNYEIPLQYRVFRYGNDASDASSDKIAQNISPFSIASIPYKVNYFPDEVVPAKDTRLENYWLYELGGDSVMKKY